MAKWTVVLFGHYKPNYYLRDSKTRLDIARYVNDPGPPGLGQYIVQADNTKRAQPGDVIDFKAFGEGWSNIEKKHFLVITVDGPTKTQMEALKERYYDLNSYEIYDPLDINTWYDLMLIKFSSNQKVLDDLAANKALRYDEYITAAKHRCRWPRAITKKRRFNIPLSDLGTMGVDINRMLNKDDLYVPTISEISHTDIYDKVSDRYVLYADKLELLKPLTDQELITP